jgi:hypothetical protein
MTEKWKASKQVFVVSERLDTSVLEVDGCQKETPIVVRVGRY